jgi:hypothetical protein
MPFSDLNNDVPRHIAFFLEPSNQWQHHLGSGSSIPPLPWVSHLSRTLPSSTTPAQLPTVTSDVFPELPVPHWRTTRLPLDSSTGIVTLRQECRPTMRVVPLRKDGECVEIMESEVLWWWCAEPRMLGRIKCVCKVPKYL